MTGRMRALCAMLCAGTMLLSGCMSTLPEERVSDGQTLPEVRSGPETSPYGNSQTDKEYEAILYLPTAEGDRLVAVVQNVVVPSGQTKHEAIVGALLTHISASDFAAGQQELRLSTVSNAVETSGNLATVILHTSALFLSDEAQFALRMAIVNTLTELPETKHVSILVNGRDYGLDVAGTIPTGVMERYAGTDISANWRALQAEMSAAETGDMNKNAALYFISEDGRYMLGEVRNVSFRSRDLASYARTLLEELAKGPMRTEGGRTLVPTLGYFERDAMLTASDEGNYIAVYFRAEIDDFLQMRGSTRAMLLSSICYTLTSFIPRLDGILAYIGGELVTEMTLMSGGDWIMQGGQITRDSVTALAADVCTVYYPLASGNGLYPVTRAIAQRQRTQPRALMRELMRPPTREQLARALPEEITDADILGLQIQDDTALLNVTQAFADACAGLGAQQERNLIYAIVNTLTEIEGVTRVRFFVDGTQSELAGHLFMGGEFLRNPGIIYTSPL